MREAEKTASSLQVRMEAMRLQVVALGAQYRMFFVWLLRTVRRANDDGGGGSETSIPVDPQAVADFLISGYDSDQLAAEFSQKVCLRENQVVCIVD